jgi:phosphoribosylanthranilate isomerase
MIEGLKIKVCGMRDPGNIRDLCALEPDLIGYIFYSGSKRYVGDEPDPEIFRIPSASVQKVGVFVDEEKEHVVRLYETHGLAMVQLHGSESPEYCLFLAERGVPIIKTYSPERIPSKGKIAEYLETVNYLLFDTPSESFGGSGIKFDWDLIRKYKLPFPFFLSGGIGPDDVNAIKDISHDWLFAVDINSRFEVEPGIKDIGLLKEFIEALRDTNG